MSIEKICNDTPYSLIETVSYPNGGHSLFYTSGNTALIIDVDICCCKSPDDIFPYSLITDKQNEYMHRYRRVFRFLKEDEDTIEDVLASAEQPVSFDFTVRTADRGDYADASPLEFLFEQSFTNVYGINALHYLQKEYGISDAAGRQYFLDYLIHTKYGDIAVEENGITFHHPQVIGITRYRNQLRKQNACAAWGIRLFRFSTDDCRFEGRIEDDIRGFMGADTSRFLDPGITADRAVRLYEHQEVTLSEIERQREAGIRTFLVVFPTASGKSRIAEEDMRTCYQKMGRFHALILAPNTSIIDDWNARVLTELPDLRDQIDIRSFSWMVRHYQEMDPAEYTYITVDEAHHAVAPVLKRVIQYFTPEFLIGLTATDQRPDRKKLETIFGTYKTGLSLPEAMEKRIVAQANVYRIETNLDLSSVRFNGKDYVNADLEKSIRVTSRNNLIADVLKTYFCGGDIEKRQGLIFCVNVAHAREMERILNDNGISAAAYTGKTKHPEKVMQDFRDRKIRFLCTVSMISEGWDYPELGILVMARPTISKVMYLQQIGRGLRRTKTKENVYIVDVVDEYGAMAKPCTMHSIFANAMYVPFGNIMKRDYAVGDMIEVDGLYEEVLSIREIDIETFEEKYSHFLNQEQLAREFYMSTGSIVSWIRKGKIVPTVTMPVGTKKLYLFSPEDVEQIREENGIGFHDDTTIHEDFFAFLKERDYSLSYKMPFLLSFLDHMNEIGDAEIGDVLDDYIAFYQNRVDRGLTVDRATCPYNDETLKDRKMIQRNMLMNPFEKFERKRFMYYSKELGKISLNHALLTSLTEEDKEAIRGQMREDLENYYKNL